MPNLSVFHFKSFQSFYQVLPGQPHPVLSVMSVVVQVCSAHPNRTASGVNQGAEGLTENDYFFA